MLAEFAEENAVGEAQHVELLRTAGWSAQEYERGVQDSNSTDEQPLGSADC